MQTIHQGQASIQQTSSNTPRPARGTQPPSPPHVVATANAPFEGALGLLERAGFVVVRAGSPGEVLDAVTSSRAHCVLLDEGVLDDGRLLARLRAVPGGADVPVLVFTSSYPDPSAAPPPGADEFVGPALHEVRLARKVGHLATLARRHADARREAAELRSARDEVAAAFARRRQLDMFVIHDLKAPVASMKLHTQLLRRDATLSPTGRESVAFVDGECDRLLHLILGLLDLARTASAAPQLRVAPTSLRELVERSVTAFELRAAERDVALHLEAPGDDARLHADPELVRRVLDNLLDNALRHASRPGVVRVSLTLLGADYEVSVSDDGPGIPESDRDRVFDPFVRLPPSSAESRGIGLAFCRQAVEAHGGSIGVGDSRDGGARFWFRLPCARP
jgi:two-component system sensor histidine kinase/response regulator